MKRSEINQIIDDAIELMKKHQFFLPPWSTMTPEEWKTAGKEYDDIRGAGLGWDVTDFAKGDFEKEGLTLFTLRNGNYKNTSRLKTYCEKIMVVRENQVTPCHFHWNKMEDIINRGGGTLCLQLWKANDDEERVDDPFVIEVDGIWKQVKGGDILRLEPGQSVCFESYIYHAFWAEGGTALVGEVSKVNDDDGDNRFFEPLGRYPHIEEDVPKKYCLCNEYDK